MKLLIAAIGRLKAGPERELFERYAKRATQLGGSVGMGSVNFREFDESKARTAEQRRAAEGRLLREAAGREAFLCALDEGGAQVTSAAWAQEIARARDGGQATYAILIGGPDGLDPEVLHAARSRVAFGAMTWPHQLARAMAAEQIYRSFTILAGHPYHRA